MKTLKITDLSVIFKIYLILEKLIPEKFYRIKPTWIKVFYLVFVIKTEKKLGQETFLFVQEITDFSVVLHFFPINFIKAAGH